MPNQETKISLNTFEIISCESQQANNINSAITMLYPKLFSKHGKKKS